ncbi:alpha/beta fold hydrolase [Paenibacillus senegalensis]|uniref:alpha/beta fold hydrolase n=1 Tax=Paenibacillus senegalensis TaxID=1465766 RepID=UPI000287D7DD|nr:hypothetical protein [Paenibacillus senegalensis]
MSKKKYIVLVDGSKLEVGLTGNSSNKVVMLPNAKKSVHGPAADNLKKWGIDPELGKKLVEGLSDTFQVLHFDYEGHLFEHPQPELLTPHNIIRDFLRIADEMQVETFSYYGYSWLALIGLQLAIRTNRLESLIAGGFPPYEGPYKEMMTVTTKTYEQALNQQNTSDYRSDESISSDSFDWENVQVNMNPSQTKQYFTMYKHLSDFDDTRIQDTLCLPKLTFAGEHDTIVYGENFGNATVDIVGILNKNEKVLRQFGWDVVILKGESMDHTKAMQPESVLPLIKSWLINRILC